MAAVVAREEPGSARDLLDAPSQLTETFGHEVRRIPVAVAAGSLDAVGLTDRTAYGIQCVTHLVPNRRKEEPAFFAELEALELALCDREPYLRVARFWQLVARRARSSA
jgi:S-adenosylmethionine-dependent methyltransferase